MYRDGGNPESIREISKNPANKAASATNPRQIYLIASDKATNRQQTAGIYQQTAPDCSILVMKSA